MKERPPRTPLQAYWWGLRLGFIGGLLVAATIALWIFIIYFLPDL